MSRPSLPILAAVAGLSVLSLAACTPSVAPSSSSPSAPADPQSPASYSGPLAFVGDELDLFLLTPEEIGGLLPVAGEVSSSSAVLSQISDGGGLTSDPRICDVFFTEHSLIAVGARSVTWETADVTDRGPGRLEVLQFADEEQAEGRMDQLLDGAEQCAEFTKDAPVSFDAEIVEESDETRAFGGTKEDQWLGETTRTFQAYASTGNVIVLLTAPLSDTQEVDATQVAALLQERAVEARETLIDELTTNPPVVEEHPAGDASAPWSDWQITTSGVGPIRIGDPVDSTLSALPGVTVTAPSADYLPWTVTAPGGVGSILIQPSGDGAKVESVTVTGVDAGAVLPTLEGIGVGAPLARAMEELPGGTIVSVASSGDHWYDVATRDGHLIRFGTDRDGVDPNAVIVSIETRDATMTPRLELGS